MLSLAKAKQAIEAAEKKAQELGIAVTTAIVDEHGDLIALSRMDGALFISPDFAITKAFTAAKLRLPTEKLGQFTGEGKPYFGLNTLFSGKLTPMAGGLPVVIDGKTVGAVGVGGSQDVSQDAACAQEAKAILEMAH
jgi:uncharacterized protein GlcG (DUF336 family)